MHAVEPRPSAAAAQDPTAPSAWSISPTPTDEEAAAVVAAIAALAGGSPAPALPAPTPAWRWSGRWWAPRPVAADRRRPWS